MRPVLFIILSFFSAVPVASLTFSDADVQLLDSDVANFKSISFGGHSDLTPARAGPQCRTFPGDPDWPTDTEWLRFNTSLNGALLKPLPPAAVCYRTSPAFNAAACSFLVNNASSTSFFFDDPVTVRNQWREGNTCLASLNPTGNCTQGGFPVYVVNATTVKQVQAAVNFARNKNLRLIIKNTGHDTSGRNVGAGSLGIWTHYLKSFEFTPHYTQPGGNYRGAAARGGAGLQVADVMSYSRQLNITIPAGSCGTVGPYGGWFTGGGHSPLSSTFGLGVDQVLSIQVVTADGRYITADPKTNKDLFFALRGGGGGTYGVITSAIVKAQPSVSLTIASFTFTYGNTPSTASGPAVTTSNQTAFWDGFNEVYKFALPTVDAGGLLWTTATPLGNSSVQMQVRVQMVNKTPAETAAFVQPLVEALNNIGIPITIQIPTTSAYFDSSIVPTTGGPGNIVFASRLFPRASWENTTLFAATMAAIRTTVESNHMFHGLNMAPTEKAGGYSFPAGVNPVWRTSIMHADIYQTVNMATATPAQATAAHDELNSVMNLLRAATPSGGAYFNEADGEEPDWQHSFFGENYETLLQIKRARDPGQLFWAYASVGSEGWAVKTPDGLPTQNGRLCRV
ncbi:hypothetical protein B0T22DRAFT_375436 [Podospora appendiculata]|uniref:FAD-binding PCMH-type domain-containing protein n=1 Tax=Podospora appendiculata TaxID=314037 RepID=A0AAE0X7E0_9PEZI|nr:hypothetical protein B0T22DRAFT_375436 [Podospora appendiculata]